MLPSRERQDRNNVTSKCPETQQECASSKATAMCAAFCLAKRKRGWVWDCCRRAVEAHEMMEQTSRKAASLALLPIEKLLINWNSFSCFWSASTFLNSNSYKKITFFVHNAVLYLKD